jgi:endonuclease/exonuclease/phosphatase (EEP) superfamily protein YafD
LAAQVPLQSAPTAPKAQQTPLAPEPQSGMVVEVVLVVDGLVLVVVALHAVTQPAGAPSPLTLNVSASFGFGVAVAVPPQ